MQMKRIVLASLLALSCLLPAQAKAADEIVVNGSTTVLPIMQKVSEAYMAANPNVQIALSGGGSGTGLKSLLDGITDVAMSSRDVKSSETKLAASKNMELTRTVIAVDALVPIVNGKNPVKDLSIDQLRDIFSGKITNWKEVGGEDLAIVPFQRGEDSGSQTLFRKLLIQGGELMDPPTELAPAAMGELVDSIAAYNNSANAIGFSVYYYIDQMYSQPGLRLLAVDGVTPSNDTIASESYPLCNEFYAVLHADAAADSPERQLYDWLDTTAGQDCIKKSGYVAVAPATGTTVD